MMHVTQTIMIRSIRIEAISNSSMLQIGTSGLVKPLSQLFNTGGFSGPAPTTGEGLLPSAGGMIPAPQPYPPPTELPHHAGPPLVPLPPPNLRGRG